MVDACMVENPMRMRAKLLRLTVIRYVDAQRCGGDFALQPLQHVQQLQALLVAQHTRSIHHARELHLVVAEYLIGSPYAIATRRTLILSTRVDCCIASWTNRHAPLIPLF